MPTPGQSNTNTNPPRSSLRRAWTDSEKFRKGSWVWFWIFNILGASAIAANTGALVAYSAPESDGRTTTAIGTFLGFVFGMVVLFFVIFVFNFIRAPYRQRNEAIRELAKSHGDDVSIAISFLRQKSLAEGSEVVTGAQLFIVLAKKLIIGLDYHSILGTLVEQFRKDGNWEGHQLATAGVDWLFLAGVIEPENRPGAALNSRGLHSSLHAMPRTVYHLTDLGRRVYNHLIDDIYR